MRLVCPNCDAEYEVDAGLIPDGGRDVQCSACGHSWFQMPPEAEAAREDEAALYDPPEAPAASPAEVAAAVAPAEMAPDPALDMDATAFAPTEAAALQAAPPAATADEDDDDIEAPSADTPPPAGRSLDESLMSLLREEAEREASARKAEGAGAEAFQSQAEIPLAPAAPAPAPADEQPAPGGIGPAAAALRKIAKLRGEPEPPPPPAADAANRPRRDLLPAIEEINSTLRAASEKREGDQGAVADSLDAEEPQGGGFRRGFLTVMLVLILALGLYLLAPILSAKVPALKGAMDGYVAAVDSLRSLLRGLARAIISKATGVTGGQG